MNRMRFLSDGGDDVDDGEMVDWQQIVLVVATLISAVVSILGSSTIIYNLVITNNNTSSSRNARMTFERIMLAMSAMDILYSISLGFQQFLTPRGSYIFSVGNHTTCRIMGTLSQISIANILYYGMLSWYFVLIVKLGLSKSRIATRYEPFMLTIPITWALISGLAGAAVDWYDVLETFPGCWIDNFPRGCDDYEVKCYSPLIAWISAGMWYLMVCASIIVNNTLVYLHVRAVYHRSLARRSSSLSGTLEPDSQERRLRSVATQCYLFVCVFFLSSSPFFIMQVLESIGASHWSNSKRLYPVWLLQAVLTPLTGLLNAIVFFRPRYISLRSHNCEDCEVTRWQAFKYAIREPYDGSHGMIEELLRRRRRSRSRIFEPPLEPTGPLEAQSNDNISSDKPQAPEPRQISRHSSSALRDAQNSSGGISSTSSTSQNPPEVSETSAVPEENARI